MTGIGVTALVPEIKWVARNPNYPAEPKFIGELTTSTGEDQWFVSDRRISTELEQIRVIGRLVKTGGGQAMHISEVFDDDAS